MPMASVPLPVCLPNGDVSGPSVLAITTGAAGDIFAQRESERVDWRVAEAMVRQAGRQTVMRPACLSGLGVVQHAPWGGSA